MKPPAVELLADNALLLRFADRVDAKANRNALRLAERLREQAPAWLRDLVPAYASLAVFFDARRVDSVDPQAFVATALAALMADPGAHVAAPARIVEIPVCYDGPMAPDLADAAALLGVSPETLVHRHSGAPYTVAMIGFAPGFPYLVGLPEALAMPRLATPRTQVPAGSVAIGGNQTGIYPRASPGGWRLIGRTPLRLFDAARAAPSLLMPGDHVVFRRIDAGAFAKWPQ